MAYVDSNVFLYPILYSTATQPKAKKAKEILLKIEKGQLQAFTSTLTWDEVVWVTSKQIGRSDGNAQGHKLMGFPNIHFITVDERIIAQAQALIEKYKLSPRDAIHAASAVEKKLKPIISDDEDFDQLKELKRTPIDES